MATVLSVDSEETMTWLEQSLDRVRHQKQVKLTGLLEDVQAEVASELESFKAGRVFCVGGDVIVAVEGKPVTDMSELQTLISKDKVGQRVNLKILRGSQTINVQVTLGNRPQNTAY